MELGVRYSPIWRGGLLAAGSGWRRGGVRLSVLPAASATALEQIRQAGYVQPGDVAEAAEAILHRNARTVYRL
jgi:hypothetical protein